jgi:hypothetical protein
MPEGLAVPEHGTVILPVAGLASLTAASRARN